MARRLSVIPSGNAELDRVQRDVRDTFKPLVNNPLMGGHLLEEVRLSATGANHVGHGLGRRYSGWFLVSPKQWVSVWESEEQNNNRERILKLEAAADCVVRIYVW